MWGAHTGTSRLGRNQVQSILCTCTERAQTQHTHTHIHTGLQMRSTIKAVFPDRDAFTLVRPALLEDDLAQLDKLPYDQLRPEFKQVGGHRQEARLLR